MHASYRPPPLPPPPRPLFASLDPSLLRHCQVGGEWCFAGRQEVWNKLCPEVFQHDMQIFLSCMNLPFLRALPTHWRVGNSKIESL